MDVRNYSDRLSYPGDLYEVPLEAEIITSLSLSSPAEDQSSIAKSRFTTPYQGLDSVIRNVPSQMIMPKPPPPIWIACLHFVVTNQPGSQRPLSRSGS